MGNIESCFSRMTQALVLVDDCVDGDRRVLQAMDELGKEVRVIDIRLDETSAALSSAKLTFAVVALIFQALWFALPRSRRLSRFLVWRNVGAYLRGMPACIRWLKCAVLAARRMRNESALSDVMQVHANDLYCAVAAIRGGFSQQVCLIYDSHELQIHRNRKTGLLRILIEYGLEQMALQRANELRVVNQAISTQMREWYALPSVVRVVYNDFFQYHPVSIPSAAQAPVLVYVGKGVQGRKLELLDFSPDALGFEVILFLLGAKLPLHIDGRHWSIGPVDYSEALFTLVRERRCLMWCCLETLSLSYRLATPNKFFQALAMGIPVVATRGTYLAEIVEEHQIGVVIDEEVPPDLSDKVSGPDFERWVANVELFRDRFRNGSVVI